MQPATSSLCLFFFKGNQIIFFSDKTYAISIKMSLDLGSNKIHSCNRNIYFLRHCMIILREMKVCSLCLCMPDKFGIFNLVHTTAWKQLKRPRYRIMWIGKYWIWSLTVCILKVVYHNYWSRISLWPLKSICRSVIISIKGDVSYTSMLLSEHLFVGTSK